MANEDLKVYIVEDDPDLNQILEHNLQREGYNTLTFVDGMEAHDEILENPPDFLSL